MSGVMCHVSGVMCQVSGVRCHIFFLYQGGLPRLVEVQLSESFRIRVPRTDIFSSIIFGQQREK